MKLLIVTQAVDRDDPILGFFLSWIEEFARHCERVEVICLREGLHTLPGNVRVHSLGKTGAASSSLGARITYSLDFLSLIYKLRHQYDAVFVHMNPEYVVLGGLWWRSWGKRVALWYVHKSLTLRLRIAALFASAVCTAAPESIQLRSPKVRALGHGIDTGRFAPRSREPSQELRILTVGRIGASKGLLEILQALDVLQARHVPFHWAIVGVPVTEKEQAYAATLRQEVTARPFAAQIEMRGAVAHEELPQAFAASDFLVNISSTGGYDKVVLEALACGIPAVSSSEPFRALLASHGLFIEVLSPETIADALVRAKGRDVSAVRAEVLKRHSLTALIPRILELLGTRSL